MQKKKVITLISFLLLLAAVAVVWLLPSSKPEVVGTVSPQNLTEIERAIHHEIWRGTLPDYSWGAIKRLPGNLLHNSAKRILRVECAGGFAKATIGTGKTKETEALRPAYYDIYLKHELNGWEALGPAAYINPDLLNLRSF